MRRLLFLDFDGVLHPATCASEEHLCRVDILANALSGKACDLIISSSWRHHHNYATLIGMFPDPLRERFAGTTGHPRFGRWPRHQEIVAFASQFPEQMEWRALDDSRNEFPPNCPELIACDPNIGMASRQVIALQAWLRH